MSYEDSTRRRPQQARAHQVRAHQVKAQARKPAPQAASPSPSHAPAEQERQARIIPLVREDEHGMAQVTQDTPIRLADMPAVLCLPDALVRGMEHAWQRSFPAGQSQEQGGILVRNQDGSYEFKHSALGNPGAILPNYGDRESNQILIGSGHTHPYDASEGGYTDVSFSGADIANLIYQEDRIKLVHSGKAQFVVVRTREFSHRIQALDEHGRMALYQDIKDHWSMAFQATAGTLPVRAHTATRSTCLRFELAYYEGTQGIVRKVDRLRQCWHDGTAMLRQEACAGVVHREQQHTRFPLASGESRAHAQRESTAGDRAGRARPVAHHGRAAVAR